MRACLVLFFLTSGSFAQGCPEEKIPAKYREIISYFKASQKIILGEALTLKNPHPRADFLNRARSKNWDNYNWPLLANDWNAIFKGEEYYLINCKKKSPLLIDELAKDYKSGLIAPTQEEAFFRSLLLYWPCADAFTSKQIRNLINDQFLNKTERIFKLFIRTESEMSLYLDHYKACGVKKMDFMLMNRFLGTHADEIKKLSLDKNVNLRLKNLRVGESRFESSQYFFKRLDEILAQ